MVDDRARVGLVPEDDIQPFDDRPARQPTPVDTRPDQTVTVVRASAPGEVESRVEVAVPTAPRRDRARWGPILAGVFTSIASLMVLTLLGLALSLSTNGLGGNANQAGGGFLGITVGTLRMVGLWLGVATILAFFLGGMVAGGAAAVETRNWAALNGVLVFLVGLPVLMVLLVAGLSTTLGMAGGLLSSLGLTSGLGVGLLFGGGLSGLPMPSAAASESTAWSTLGAMVLALGAAALGGYLAAQRDTTGRA